MMLYKYGMKARGFSIGCQPGGVKYYEDADKLETGYWNYIYYDRELTEEEMKKYELKFICKGAMSSPNGLTTEGKWEFKGE